MLRDCKEEDFDELKAVSIYRLSPDGIFAGLIGAFVYSGVMSVVMAFALSYSTTITSVYWSLIQKLDLGLLILQFLFVLLFAFQSTRYRFQTLQSIVLCAVFLKMSLDGYKVYFLSLEDRNSPTQLFDIGIGVIVGGLLVLIWAVIRAIGKVEQGKITQDGTYLYPVSRRTAIVIAIILIGAMMIARVSESFIDKSYRGITGPVSLLVIFSILQYALAIAWPEFFLLAYAKSKFPGFALEPSDMKASTDRGTIKNEKRELPKASFKQSLAFWWTKPISVIKSRAGGMSEKKAPFWMLIVIWLETSFALGAGLLLFTLLGKQNRLDFAEGPVRYAEVYFYFGLAAALLLLIAVRIGVGRGRGFSKDEAGERGRTTGENKTKFPDVQ
ncbi:hypothetical protein [Cohnella cellulosilytica]|uniref:Uncharacterized protein n=1 Tax=Cohnella cellulosilytica TaxID=986710 RepID=A0ABW2F521_9BACL